MIQPSELKEQADRVKSLLDFYQEPTRKLIAFLYRQKYTQGEIGKILGISRQAVWDKYPKQKLLKEYETSK